ncbi:MAG: hypothetical protein E6Q94_10145 [Burkholderiaceae bacterium]|jgi:hypothetical protein|nr:MAG: hypothetical protein E6Q94_10145 [Burkholderiaceae bacterium]
MHWLFLLLAFAAMAFAFMTTTTAILAGCLLAALVLFLLWIMGMYQARVAGASRDATTMLDPVEMRRLREQAEARKADETLEP